ncbi:MAG: sugar porter family MFS transporter [Prolixibacteraceae bacterium]|jgi:MFS transporter, SP family, arabinose:H+ symporter|nr:sugar porter family MFS transporter [Prolixibacteraceae bacterium]MBT6764186.1 sugar porter family MFS transporter [Prolixibacteraceae bacterium]MBT6999464.1 sugar porter family MFS transporter [Prolixibacteraceae bacterium]MBT7396842.1 sugar porter family MFS transporter [Prolixibacteraceae bacterium]
MVKNKNLAFIWWLTITASLGGLLFGYDTAVISGTLSMVRSQFVLNAAMEGWYVSSALVGCVIGVSFAGWLSDKNGRKKVLILAAILFTISAIGCTFSNSFSTLILYRMLGGMGVGIASMLSPMYISEISPPKIRGRLVALYQLAIAVGILGSYFINAWLLNQSLGQEFFISNKLTLVFKTEVWRAMLGMESIPALTFLILLITVPESPRWLVIKGHRGKAKTILLKAGGEEEAEQEIKEIRDSIELEKKSKNLILDPGIKLALFLGVSLAVLQQFTGIDAIIYYGPRIMEQAGFGLSDALGSQVLIGAINMLFTLLAIWKIDKFGRKPLLITGTMGMFISLIAIGTLFMLGKAEGIFLLSLILIFIASFAFSLGPVVWVILSEIYPTRIRGRAMSIATMAVWIGTSTIGQFIPLSLDNIGPAFTFWIFALFCIPTLWIGWKIMPETKGKTLEDIEKYWLEFKSKKKK